MIKKDMQYRIKGRSQYFKKKYGTSNPVITIEDTDKVAFGQSWMKMDGNPACMLYGMRSAAEKLPYGGEVYYGKIKLSAHKASLGELVHETELEEV